MEQRWQHLKEIDRLLKSALDRDDLAVDDVTRAHFEELRDQLDTALDAQVEAGDF